MSNLYLKLMCLQKRLNMCDSEFYWFLELVNRKGIITATDIINNQIRYEEVLDE